MKGLTKKQREILDFIEEYISRNRFSPSYREIGKHFGFSSLGSVYNHLHSMTKKGVLNLQPHVSRSMIPEKHAEESSAEVFIPLAGVLRGGMSIDFFSESKFLPVSRAHLPADQECYLLQIKGDALMEELMQEDDLLLIAPKTHAESGEMVLALINKHTTLVKRIYFDPPYVRFESANPHVQSFMLSEDHVQIQGIILHLFRSYSS